MERHGIALFPVLMLTLLAAGIATSLAVPEGGATAAMRTQLPLREVLRHPTVLALFVVCFFMQVGHGPYYAFYSIYLQDHGYSATVIGQLWALGVVAEIGIFLIMPRVLSRFDLRQLLVAAAAAAVLRWWLLGAYAEYRAVVIGSQLLHAATFGVHHAAAIQLIHRQFVGRHQGRGQALYSSVSFGAGGAAGALMAGALWESIGPAAAFYAAAAASAIALVCAAHCRLDPPPVPG